MTIKEDNCDKLAQRITEHPRMRQILDKANQEHACFAVWLADFLRHERVYALPRHIEEALNSDDGVYRP